MFETASESAVVTSPLPLPLKTFELAFREKFWKKSLAFTPAPVEWSINVLPVRVSTAAGGTPAPTYCSYPM